MLQLQPTLMNKLLTRRGTSNTTVSSPLKKLELVENNFNNNLKWKINATIIKQLNPNFQGHIEKGTKLPNSTHLTTVLGLRDSEYGLAFNGKDEGIIVWKKRSLHNNDN